MKFDGLCNLTEGKIAQQSSMCERSRPDDASRAFTDDGKRAFSFHTDIEDNPWWQVDLGDAYPVYYIVIGNRRKNFQEKAITITVETSLDGQAWQLIHTGLISWHNDLIWPLGGLVSARFVRLSLREKAPLHLTKVEVWGVREGELMPEAHVTEALWVETKPDGLKELHATIDSTTKPDELIIALEGDFHSIWAMELTAPLRADFAFPKNLKVESSLDGCHWQIIHEGLLACHKYVYYPLRGEVIAGFFKVSFPETDLKELPQVKIFSRVYRNLEVRAHRRDGTGGRMFALLTGLYIAKLLNCNFKFNWQASIPTTASGDTMESVGRAEEVFSANFLQECFLEQLPPGISARSSKLNTSWKTLSLSHHHLIHPYWHDIPGVIVAPYTTPEKLFHARIMPPKSYYKFLFDNMPFGEEYVKMINLSKNIELPADYTALQVRSGIMVYGKDREAILSSKKVVPLQLIKMNLEKLKLAKRNIIIFGQDDKDLEYLSRTYNIPKAADYLPAGEEFKPPIAATFLNYLLCPELRIFMLPLIRGSLSLHQ